MNEDFEFEFLVELLTIPSTQNYSRLRKRLENCTEEWMKDFLSRNGLASIFCALHRINAPEFRKFADAKLQSELTRCIKAVANSKVGMDYVVQDQSSVEELVLALDTKNVQVKSQLFEILIAVCWYHKTGLNNTLNAFEYFKVEKKQKDRFSVVMQELKDAEFVPYKTALFTFINTLIVSCADVDAREIIRAEFINLGLTEIINDLRNTGGMELKTQVQAFEQQQMHDWQDLVTVDGISFKIYVDVLHKLFQKVAKKPASISLFKILHKLLLMNHSNPASDLVWETIEVSIIKAVMSLNIPEAKENLEMQIKDVESKPTFRQDKEAWTQTNDIEPIEYAVSIKPEVSDFAVQTDSSSETSDLTIKDGLIREHDEGKDLLSGTDTCRSNEALPYPQSALSCPPLPPPSPTSSAGVSQSPQPSPIRPPTPPGAGYSPQPPTPSPPPPDAGILQPSPPPPPPGAGIAQPSTMPPSPPSPPSGAGISQPSITPPPPPSPPPGAGISEPSTTPPSPPSPPPGAEISQPSTTPPSPPSPPPGAGISQPSITPPPPPPAPFNGGISQSPPPSSPPPPPPLGDEVLQQTVSKYAPEVPPKSRIRRLRWTTIPNSQVQHSDNSIWKKALEFDGVTLDHDKGEKLFQLTKARKIKYRIDLGEITNDDQEREEVEEKSTNRIYERSFEVDILLENYRRSSDDIMAMISSGESAELGLDRLKSLRKILPNDEEIEMIRKYDGDKTKLGKSEEFLSRLIDVESYKVLIDGMILREEARMVKEDFEKLSLPVKSVIKDLMENELLPKIFHVILKVGNFLNYGLHFGNANGFRIYELDSLKRLPSNVSYMNLLDFIVEVAESNNVAVTEFPSQMRNLEQAIKFDFNFINKECRRLRGTLGQFAETGKKMDGNVGKRFSKLIEDAERDISILEDGLNHIKQLSDDLAIYLCEDPKKFKLLEVLDVFMTFCDQLATIKKRKDRSKEEHKKRLQHEYDVKYTSVVNTLLADIKKGFPLKKQNAPKT